MRWQGAPTQADRESVEEAQRRQRTDGAEKCAANFGNAGLVSFEPAVPALFAGAAAVDADVGVVVARSRCAAVDFRAGR